MILHDFPDPSWLASQATKLEEFIKEKKKSRWAFFAKEQMIISVIQEY